MQRSSTTTTNSLQQFIGVSVDNGRQVDAIVTDFANHLINQ